MGAKISSRLGNFGPPAPLAAIAVPFLVGIAALRGLTVALPMFHGSDEFNYHYPTILRFSRELPFPDLANYNAAQTPLFHVLMAYVGQLTGYQLWRLRLVEALISYLLGLSVYWLLRRRFDMARLQAVALTLLFVLSPYVYATSFRLLTDNLALLFSVLAFERCEAFREDGRLGPLLAGCACAGAAILTRQSTAFVFAVAGLYALLAGGASTRSMRTRVIGVCGVLVAAAPGGLLFITWHGLTPPGGDTASCGLCAGSGSVGGTGLRMQTAELTLAVTGLYGAVLFAPAFPWRDRAAVAKLLPGALACALAGAILLAVFPMRPDLHPASGPPPTAGVLWNAAAHTPSVAGSPLLFWLLLPLAGIVLRWRLAVAPRKWLPAVLLGCFLLGALVIRLAWQKYVDPYALLVVMVTAGPLELNSVRRLAGAGMLAVFYVAYTLSFVV